MRQILPARALLGLFLTAALMAASGAAQTMAAEQVQHQIERAKIFREAYPVIADVDLYCSLFIHEGEIPDLMIVGAERSYEKTILSDTDTVYLNQGKSAGIEIGQVFLAVEIGESLGGFGRLAHKRGRVHVVFVEDERSLARVERSCEGLRVGNYLVPFEEKEILLGKDLGYEVYTEEDSGPVGKVIYLERDYNQIGSGAWAVIDLGAEHGLQFGQQMTLYKRIQNPQTLELRADLPRVGVGSAVVIDTTMRTATVKVLSCWDSVTKGQWIQGK